MQPSRDGAAFDPVGIVCTSNSFELSDSEVGLAHTLLWSIGEIHTNELHMASTPFGAPLVAGPFLAALAAGIQRTSTMSDTLARYVWMEDAHSFTVTYRKPVLAGDAVVVQSTVTSYDEPVGDRPGMIGITDECQTPGGSTLLRCARSHRCQIQDGTTVADAEQHGTFADTALLDRARVGSDARGRTISQGEIALLTSLARLGPPDGLAAGAIGEATSEASVALPNQLTMAIVVSLGSLGPFFAALEHDNDFTMVAALSHSAEAFMAFHAGDTVTVESTLTAQRESDSRPGHHIVHVVDIAVNQRGEKCMKVTRALLMRRNGFHHSSGRLNNQTQG